MFSVHKNINYETWVGNGSDAVHVMGKVSKIYLPITINIRGCRSFPMTITHARELGKALIEIADRIESEVI